MVSLAYERHRRRYGPILRAYHREYLCDHAQSRIAASLYEPHNETHDERIGAAIKTAWGNFYWPYWLILTSLTFIVPELLAVFTNAANTLTRYTHIQLSVTTATVNAHIHTVAWYVSLIGWLVFVVLITIHIWWAGP